MFHRSLLLLVLPGLLLAKTPITHESMWLMKRVGAPVPSPDGKWVVFSVTNPSYDEKEQTSDLWLVPSDRSAKPRKITFTKSPESGVTWSPDSRRIAFSTKREGDEAPQVYVLDLAAGGEAMRLTSLALGASGPRFSPDGSMVLFNSSVYPGALTEADNKKIAADRKALKYHVRSFDTFPIRHWDKWLEETQTHLFVQEMTPGAAARDLLARTRLAMEPGFAGTPTSTSEDLHAAWAPDGKSIVFSATANRNTAAYAPTNTHLYVVSVNGGEPKQITSGKDSYSKPVFRPDGKALYCTHSREGEKLYSLNRIAMFQWPNPSERTLVTAAFDRSAESYAFTPDSRTIYLTAEDAGHEKLYSVPTQGGAVTVSIDLNRGVYSNVAIPEHAASPVLFANWEDATRPLEIVRLDPAAKSHTFLTDFNEAKAAELDVVPLREFWFTATRGKKIHSMIASPPNFDERKKYPLIVLMHGGPHGMWRDQWVYRWNYHLLAAPGYIVLLTDYTGSTGYGEKFAQDIQGDPLKGPAEEINEAADYAVAHFAFIDGSRECAAGASYGGHLANWMQASTNRYKCLVSHAGLVNLESQWATSDSIYHREIASGGPVWEQGPVWREQNPIRYASKFSTPILLSVGERDFRVPMNNTLENWAVLQRRKIPARLLIFPDENHWILNAENSRYYYGELEKWFAKYLSEPGASASGSVH